MYIAYRHHPAAANQQNVGGGVVGEMGMPREREDDYTTVHLPPHIFAFDCTHGHDTRRMLLLD